MPIADTCGTIAGVTQDISAGCPLFAGRLSAMNLESLSAISGMRISMDDRAGIQQNPEPIRNYFFLTVSLVAFAGAAALTGAFRAE